MRGLPRRRYVQALGALAAGTVAGCADGGPDRGTPGTIEAPGRVAAYLSETSNFEGYMTDETDAERPSVAVGAEGNGGFFAFDPPAMRIATETTVVWEWTGRGADHNVVEESDYFSSGESVSGEDATFELGFQEPGIYRYYCGPHEGVEMKGALVVR